MAEKKGNFNTFPTWQPSNEEDPVLLEYKSETSPNINDLFGFANAADRSYHSAGLVEHRSGNTVRNLYLELYHNRM